MSAARAQRLGSALTHRGPDDLGFMSWHVDRAALADRAAENLPDGSVWLAHRRLAIIDLTDGGWQPMQTPDHRFCIVYNGEIYNYKELRGELQALGVAFRSRSDTEVLLQGFAVWGLDVLPRLTGMFAFAVFDAEERKLHLARDHFGIKPLYYTQTSDGCFVFASEIRALLQLPEVDRTADAESLYSYLRFGRTDHGPGTMFGAIKSVPAASSLTLGITDAGIGTPARYWQLPSTTITGPTDGQTRAEELRQLFLDSVSLHLRSDVPIAVELSGGIDSSAICSVVRQLEPDRDISTFSYAAASPTANEEKWIDLVVAHIGSRPHKVRVELSDLRDDAEHLVGAFDEPVATTSIYAQRRIYQHIASCGLKVSLNGQGADELLGGYPTFRTARVASLIRQRRWPEAARLLRAILGGHRLDSPRRELARLATWVMPDWLSRFGRRAVGETLTPDWLNTDWLAAQGAQAAGATRPSGKEALRALLLETLTDTSLPGLLRYADRNSMAFSVECRVPFLTPPLAEFVLALPEESIISADGATKHVFRQAMNGLVPDAILDRRDKIGFETPERDWLVERKDWVSDVLESSKCPILNGPEILREWRRVVDGRVAYGSHIWRSVNLLLWVNSYRVTGLG